MLLPEEWDWLRTVTADSPERDGMTGSARVLLYAVAIQTGLRASELRSLTRGRLFLGEDKPFITCKAGQTKNAKDARQYVQPDLADNLARHAASKTPGAAVFNMPRSEDVADMLRADLAAARRDWLKATKHDPDEYERRTQCDFLTEKNHEGETLDFHSLRHTCGAWLAMKGAHPKAVQAIMRHSTITLTMDTCFRGRKPIPWRGCRRFSAMARKPCERQERQIIRRRARSARRSSQSAKLCGCVRSPAKAKRMQGERATAVNPCQMRESATPREKMRSKTKIRRVGLEPTTR